MKSEAAVLVGLIEGAVIAVIGVLAYMFGWAADFAVLVTTAASAIVALIGGLLLRGQVWSQDSVDALKRDLS